jgi:hypothetical protein
MHIYIIYIYDSFLGDRAYISMNSEFRLWELFGLFRNKVVAMRIKDTDFINLPLQQACLA